MAVCAWLEFCNAIAPGTRTTLQALLHRHDIAISAAHGADYVLFVLGAAETALLPRLRELSRRSMVLALVLLPEEPDRAFMWQLLGAGARDVLWWHALPDSAEQIAARFVRWERVRQMADSPRVRNALVGASPCWRSLVRGVVEVAAFTHAPVLITGESGTGKELIARLIHDLDERESKANFVVVDCTTLSPELTGSELFGHERGAFTGALNARDGAFALANHGTLFLDEIGELPLVLQAQLLRVVQEGKHKRVGSNTWLHTDFRLVCATNRDLEAEVAKGHFRADLYYRIAGWTCRTPPLRERRDDVLELAQHFARELQGTAAAPQFDESVRDYLQQREYPGNVRDLRRIIMRLCHRHAGPGPITIGDIPEEDRPALAPATPQWPDEHFENAIARAVRLGVGLREIGRAATDSAIRLAVEEEGGNLRRAASRLQVTDRALQLRRANQRDAES
jgi:transcriptional regulator with GAF, ATPase, and Fis domain